MTARLIKCSFMTPLITVLALCGLLLNATRVKAQRYPFFNIGIEEGLVQSQVFSLLQDSMGHLWAGTLGGLSCYDGHGFRTYTMRDGLPSNTATSLCCDRSGKIWIGTARGLSCYDGRSFRNYYFTSPDNPKGNSVMQLSMAQDGTLWTVAGQSLYALREGKIVKVGLPAGVAIVSTLCTMGNEVWTCPYVTRSIYRYREGKWDSLALPNEKLLYVYRIYQDAEKRTILITGNGVFRNEAGAWIKLYERHNNKEPLIYSFAEAADGSYWISTSKGAVRLANGQAQHFTKQNGFTDLVVYDIIRDRENNLWMATNGEGLFRFSGAPFTAIDERMGLEGPQVSSIAQDDKGNTYFGSYDGGLYRYSGGVVQPIHFPGVSFRVPVSSLEFHDNILWIGTQAAGLWQYNTASGKLKRYNDRRLGVTIVMMAQDSTGIWVCDGKSVLHASHDSMSALNVKNSIEAFALVGRDSLILSSTEGLLLYTGDTARPFRTNSAADSGQIVCMTSRNGNLWIGTGDNGLFGYKLQTGSSIHITRKEGLRSDFIYNLYAAPDGTIWAGTGFGICHIKPVPPHPSIAFYGRNAGLTGMESNKNAVFPMHDGSIWFGTTGGALLYHPNNTVAVTRPVSMQLTNIALFGEPVKDTEWFHGTTPFYAIPQGLHLPWQKNNLSFSFSAVTLTGEEAVVYRYRLEGLAAPWSEWSNANTVTFSALPPGRYELIVQCSTDGIHPQPQELHYSFEIITPFHKTNLFRLLVIVACIILGVALQYLAARRKRVRRAQLEAVRREEQAKVRQRTAEDFHDEVGNKLTRINVLTNVLRSKVGPSADASRLIDQIQDNAGQLYSGTRDILWSLQPSNDNLFQVMNRIRDFARDLFGDTDTDLEMAEVPQGWREYPLAMDASRNLIMIFKEALNNVLKYSGATHVSIESTMQGNQLTIVLRDNGEGFDQYAVKRGQGITNMKTRAGRLGGTLELVSAAQKGTTITLEWKIPQNTLLHTGANSRTL